MQKTIDIPPALVLGTNTPHGIGVLSDWIEEQTGSPLDLDQSSWSDEYGDCYGRGRSYSYGYGDGYGNGYGNGNGNCYCNGNGYGYGYGYVSGFGCGHDYGDCYGRGIGCGYGNN